MKKRVITVSRQFGSGGRTIAKKIAKDLGLPYYDKELVAKIAKETGYAEEYIEEMGQYAFSRRSFLFSLAVTNSYTHNPGELSVPDKIYIMQNNIINELAEKEECVIVGRCADYILREREDCLHTFFFADMDFRANHIVEYYGETDVPAEKRVKEKDDKRRVYYRHYTGREWGDVKNYHVSLDTGAIGLDACADAVVAIYRNSK